MNRIFVFVFCVLALQTVDANPAPVWHMVNCSTTSQGDCHLLEDNGVYTIIDAGESHIAARTFVPYLQSREISRIEHFFVSHPHTDHYGGLVSIIDAGIMVGNIYYNNPPSDVSDFNYKPEQFAAVLAKAEAMGAALHNIRAGFTLSLPNSSLAVIEAKKTRQGDVNDYSLIMTWDAGGYRTLFAGDLNKQLGTELATVETIKADILKVPHHGVTGIAPDSFFDGVKPSLLMIPSQKLLWRHPRGRQVRLWAEKNWAARRTHVCNNGFNGDVRIAFYEDYLDLDPQIPNGSCPKKQWRLIPIDKPVIENLNRVHVAHLTISIIFEGDE